MTFDEYNTDEVFEGDSTADELVKKGYDEGKTREEIETSLSPLWKEDKKGNVKKALDKYYTVATPKKEEVKEEVKETEKPAEPFKEEDTPKTTSITEEDTGIKQSDQAYMNDINAILNEEQKQELNRLSKTFVDSYNRTMENIERTGDAYKKIDDKLIDQLPTFMFRRYQNGEFGDPKSTDAKLRLAYFMINGIQSKLKVASNLAMANAGKSPMFSDTTSDYEKYQQTNLGQGLENRWNKYKQETQNAIDLVKQRGIENEEALNIINKISMNNRLQNAYNMADANKKAYMIEVLSKIGDKVSNWNDTKFVNALVGAEITGEDVGSATTLIGARAGEKILDNFNLIDENGNIDLSVLKQIKDLPGIKDAFKEKGIDLDKLNLDGKSEGGESNTDATLEDGTKVDPGKYMNSKEYKELVAAGDKLSDQYYNGEIDEKKFRSEYAKLEKIMSEHGWFSFFRNKGIKSADDLIKVNNQNNLIRLSDDLDKLNSNAKNLTKDEYTTQYNKLKESAIKWGITDKQLNAMESDYKKYLKKAKSK